MNNSDVVNGCAQGRTLVQPPFDPAAIVPFFGYRRFDTDGPAFELVASLVHHFEAEKFRGVDETIRRGVLDCPTPKLAQKMARRHMELWRKDWKAVRGRVFRAGLAMQVIQSRKVRTAARHAFELSMELTGSKRIGGLPSTFVATELQTFFQKASSANCGRLSVLALRGCVPDDVEARLDAVFAHDRPLSALVYAGSDADPRVEAWCMANAVPVRVCHQDAGRLREHLVDSLIQRINTMLMCIPPQRKVSNEVLAMVRARRPRIKLINLGPTA